MHAELLSVRDLFSANTFKPARVQRQYVWDVSQCETFHNDLLDAFQLRKHRPNYYLGPIIVSKAEPDTSALVYDGQQRLTTLTIYLAALGRVLDATEGGAFTSLAISQKTNSIRPRIDLRTRGGSLTRVVRNVLSLRNVPSNMPVDWRIYSIESRFLERLKEVDDLAAFAQWVADNVLLNVLWAEDTYGLVLFDRANTRGVRLHWYELVKSVVAEAVGDGFKPEPGKTFEDIWYETERETRNEFPDLIASAAFIRYETVDPAGSLAAFEDEFAPQRPETELHQAGRDLVETLAVYRRSGRDLDRLRQKGGLIRHEADLIRLQLLFLGFPQWKALLLHAGEYDLSDEEQIAFLKRLRKLSYTAHLLGWTAWPRRLENAFREALRKLKSALKSGRGFTSDLYTFRPDQLAQARGALYGSSTDQVFYRPLVKLWEAEQAFQQGQRHLGSMFVAHVEHILPQAPRGDWCVLFPDEDQRADLRNRLGNLCLLSKAGNETASNKKWPLKREIYRQESACFVSAHAIADEDHWTPEHVKSRSLEMANGIISLLDI